jgi:hypothetical protein
VNCISPISPGTEINVIPESEAPTIPNATKYQGDSLFAEKNVELSPLPFVKYEIINKPMKYEAITKSISDDSIMN